MKTLHRKIKSLLVSILLIFSFSACSDWLELLPNDEMILEDYWKNAQQVEAAVIGCYRAMLEGDCMERMIIWGELRGDNVGVRSNASTHQINVNNHNIPVSNSYALWASFYTVINQCNTVLHFAPGVMNEDPNFDIGTLRAYQAEALTIRSLMYFYLVRAYRDVPLSLEPYMDDNGEFSLEKTSGEQILEQLITDLNTAKNYAVESWNAEALHPDNKGRVTKQTVRALLADVYLWAKRYDDCIHTCDELLQANERLDELKRLKLVEAEFMFNQLFYRGNSAESIFELQFSSLLTNSRMITLYGDISNTGRLCAPNVDGSWEFHAGRSSSPYVRTDYRGKDFSTPLSAGARIFKYTGQNRTETLTGVSSYQFRGSTPVANWILYRLPDIYLMKAESLVERNSGSDLEEALALVNLTYMRANPDLGEEELLMEDYPGQSLMRTLVLDERRREFAFEGKRWFDLVRLSEREGNTDKLRSYISVTLSTDVSAQSLAANRLLFMDALYMPIHQDEIKTNPKLVQNPFYDSDSGISVTN